MKKESTLYWINKLFIHKVLPYIESGPVVHSVMGITPIFLWSSLQHVRQTFGCTDVVKALSCV